MVTQRNDPYANDHRGRLEPEFGVYSLWLAEAVVALGVDPIPPACRGTGNPALFARMADYVGAAPGVSVLDVGAGLGGPSEWLSTERGCDVTGVEIMEESVRGMRLLFPHLKGVMASSAELPFTSEHFDAAWALGALETIDDKDETLAEVYRVLRSNGRFALYSFVCAREEVRDAPAADRFEPPEVVIARMGRAGFVTVEARPAPELDDSPPGWRLENARIREEVRRVHGTDDRYVRCVRELEKMRDVYCSGEIEAWVFVLRKGA